MKAEYCLEKLILNVKVIFHTIIVYKFNGEFLFRNSLFFVRHCEERMK